MNRRTELKLKQLIVIICIWVTFGFILTIYDHLVIKGMYVQSVSSEYSFTVSLLINAGSALIGSLLGGSFLVFYVNVKYQDKPFGYTILAVSISFILIVALIATLIGIFLIPENSSGFFLFNSRTIKNTLVWSIVVALTQLFLQMNSKFGYGVFWNIIKGKYNTPKEEKRIFMSLDLNSSTAIAERLGVEKYHGFLKDFFADITYPILDNNGEIYQYVGDEVIIAWKYEEGIKDNRCINCFFEMRLKIQKANSKYLKRYGMIPQFKAGIHMGQVVVGEIGIIKRDITYSGDVMNTTSRIRDLCKRFGVDLIVSEELLEKIKSVNDTLFRKQFNTNQLESIKLRNKENEVILNAVSSTSI